MSALSLRLPQSLHRKLSEVADREPGLSDRLVAGNTKKGRKKVAPQKMGAR
jgi:hypothetical protein